MSTVDAAAMAEQFAYYEIYSAEARYNNQLAQISEQRSAYTTLQSSLNSLKSSLYDFTKYNGTVEKAAATTSSDNHLSVSVDENAVNADLDIFVEQLASSQQYALDLAGIQDPQTVIDPPTGSMKITRASGEEIYTIDIAGLATELGRDVTYQDVVNDINKGTDALNANLVRTNGELKLMISSSETGADNHFVIESGHGIPGIGEPVQIKEAQDASVRLGGETGLQLTSSTNTFTDLVDGVDVTLKSAQAPGTDSTNIQVGTDTESTLEAMQKVIDEYNSVIDTINELTATSSSEDGERGVLASDSTTRSIKSAMNSLLRDEYDGHYLFELGMELDRDGKLSIDSDKFEDALEDPAIDVNAMLIGDTGLFNMLETTVDSYSNTSTGMISSRIDTLDAQEDRINDNMDALELKYESAYDRYLSQFNAMNEAIVSMEAVMNSFVYY